MHAISNGHRSYEVGVFYSPHYKIVGRYTSLIGDAYVYLVSRRSVGRIRDVQFNRVTAVKVIIQEGNRDASANEMYI